MRDVWMILGCQVGPPAHARGALDRSRTPVRAYARLSSCAHEGLACTVTVARPGAQLRQAQSGYIQGVCVWFVNTGMHIQ